VGGDGKRLLLMFNAIEELTVSNQHYIDVRDLMCCSTLFRNIACSAFVAELIT